MDEILSSRRALCERKFTTLKVALNTEINPRFRRILRIFNRLVVNITRGGSERLLLRYTERRIKYQTYASIVQRHLLLSRKIIVIIIKKNKYTLFVCII